MSDYACIRKANCRKIRPQHPATDEIAPTHVVWKSFPEMAKHVFRVAESGVPREGAERATSSWRDATSAARRDAPPSHQQAIEGDGCGRHRLPRRFSRTFYRNGHEWRSVCRIFEAPGIHDLVETGDRFEGGHREGPGHELLPPGIDHSPPRAASGVPAGDAAILGGLRFLLSQSPAVFSSHDVASE